MKSPDKRKEKRIGSMVCAALCVLVALALFGCAGGEPASSAKDESGQSQAAATDEESETPDEPATGGNSADDVKAALVSYLDSEDSAAWKKLKKADAATLEQAYLLYANDELMAAQEEVLAVRSIDTAYEKIAELLDESAAESADVYALTQQYLSTYRHGDAINSQYNYDIEGAYDRYASSAQTYYVYLRHLIETNYDDTLLGDIQKNLDTYTATDSTLYYFANDVDSSFGATLPGNAEYVIATDKPFSHDGAQNLNLVDTGKTMSLTSSTGFTRDVEIYEVLSDDGTSKIDSDYTAWGADQAKLKDTYNALSVAITGQEIAVDEVGEAGEYSPQGTDGSFLFTTPFPELLEGSWYCDTNHVTISFDTAANEYTSSEFDFAYGYEASAQDDGSIQIILDANSVFTPIYIVQGVYGYPDGYVDHFDLYKDTPAESEDGTPALDQNGDFIFEREFLGTYFHSNE